MKLLVFLLLFNNPPDGDCKNINTIRTEFHKPDSKTKIKQLIAFCNQDNCSKSIPYKAVAIMQQAKYDWSPFEKFNHFIKGKKLLENYIVNYPNDIEARYTRWLAQKNSPFFLGYKSNIENDYKYIIKNLPKSNLSKEYQELILKNIQE